VAAPFDNSRETNLSSLSNHTGEGVVIDIGTGDGSFVSAAAKANPAKFYIGVDANSKPLEKPSTKAMRKPAKGGLPNALFVQAAVEDLPEELNGVADEIHIHFPWGSLLRAVALPDDSILSSIRQLAADGCQLEIIIGIDPVRDKTEVARLGLPELSDEHLRNSLIPGYLAAGFDVNDHGFLNRDEWKKFETSWARRLSSNDRRRVFYLLGEAI
jgi:16S rRNA (adenine(1408)-N(1))-methyltransferase